MPTIGRMTPPAGLILIDDPILAQRQSGQTDLSTFIAAGSLTQANDLRWLAGTA